LHVKHSSNSTRHSVSRSCSGPLSGFWVLGFVFWLDPSESAPFWSN